MSIDKNLIELETHEKAIFYVESALKVLGIGQIAAGATDMFWGGFNLNPFNMIIIITGLIFFFGSESLTSTRLKIQNKFDNNFNNRLVESKRGYRMCREDVLEDYHKELKRKEKRRYSFAEE